METLDAAKKQGPDTVESAPGPDTVDSGPATVDSGPATVDSGGGPHATVDQAARPDLPKRTLKPPVQRSQPAPTRPDVPEETPSLLPPSLGSRFEGTRELGRGGMGLVCIGTDKQLGREVAIKVILRPDPRQVAMFTQEARILASLEHDNVVRVYEFGVVDGLPFLIMELVRGNSLASQMSGGRKLVVDAVRIAAGIAAGLGAAHARGIAHFDLKPGNVFLDENGRAKVADFGLAQLVEKDGAAAFRGGTPGYMPPEQWDGHGGLPADVYAFGVVLHELLSGERLFRATTRNLRDLLDLQAGGPPAPPSRANPSVPGAIDDLIARCLDLDPSKRPAIADVSQALAAWLDDLRRLRGKPAALGFPPAPYKLLSNYGPDDDAIFFGREAETAELVQLVRHPDVRLIQVFGACGSGKSSLLRAGLASPLGQSGWETIVVIAGPEPGRVLRQALLALGARCGASEEDLAGLADGAARPGPLAFARAVSQVCAKLSRPLAIVMDQSEEVFTQNARGAPAIADLFEVLVQLAEIPALPLKVLLAYRIEFRGDFLPLEQRLGRLQHTFAVREMSETGLVDAIEGPSRIEHYGFSYEKGLPERLAREIAHVARARGDAALPTMQIICHQLHESLAAKGTRIDTELYETTLGGADGALKRFVEQRLESPAYRTTGSMARQILQALTRKEEGGERFANEVLEDELLDFPDRAEARRTLESLLSDHLVVRHENAEGRRAVRLASEVICPLIDAWSVEPDAAQRAARLLARCHRRWADEGRRPGLLLGGPDLDLVAAQQSNLRALPDGEVEYIRLSRARRVRERVFAGGVAGFIISISSLLVYVAFLRPGTVQLDSEPAGAEVAVDGRAVGRTPVRWEGRPGVHSVTLVKPDHGTVQAAVVVSAGGATLTTHMLPYLKGTLQLATEPAGALCELVRLAGQPAGPPVPASAPARSALRSPVVTEVYRGDYALRVTAPGYETIELPRVSIKGNRMPTVKNVVLKRTTGALAVTCAQVGARVRVLDAATGAPVARATVPLAGPLELPAGSYVLETGLPNGFIDFQSVEISRNATAALSVWCPDVSPLWLKRVKRPQGLVAVADLDRDGRTDIVVGGEEGKLRAISGRSPGTIWKHELGAKVVAPAGIGDVDGDGAPDAVVGAHDGAVRAVSGRTGEVLWTARAGGVLQSSPAIADLDGDGALDVALGCHDRKVHAFRGRTGAPLWTADAGGPVDADARAVDLDADGAADVVIGSHAGILHALSGKTGKPLWTAKLGGMIQYGCALLAAKSGWRIAAVSSKGTAVIVDGATGRATASIGDADGASSQPLALGDLDGDGAGDVAMLTADGRGVRALSGATGRTLWRWQLEEKRQYPPQLVPGVGLVLPSPTRVECLDPKTGRPRWGLAPKTGLADAPLLADVDGDGVPEVIQPTGEEVIALPVRRPATRWIHDARERVQSRPEVADFNGDGVPDLVVGGDDFAIRALDGRDGRPLWRHRTEGRTVAWPAVADLNGDGVPDVVAGSEDHGVHAIDGRTGRALWSQKTGGIVYTRPALADLDGDGAPDAVVGSRDAHVWAISGRGGKVLWKFAAEHRADADPLVVELGDGRRVVIAGSGQRAEKRGEKPTDGRIHALDGATGKKLWEVPALLPVCAGAAAVRWKGEARPRVLAPADDGRLRALDILTGHEIWKYQAGNAIGTNVALADLDGDGVPEALFGSYDGTVHAVSVRDGSAVWRASFGKEEKFWTFPFGFADLNADGRPDVVLVHADQLVVLDGRDGRTLWRVREEAGAQSAPLVLPGAPGAAAVDVVTVSGAAVLRRALPVAREPEDAAAAPASRRTPLVRGGMSLEGDRAVFTGGDRVVQAVSLASGAIAWSHQLIYDLRAPPPVAARAVPASGGAPALAVFGNPAGEVCGLDLATGRPAFTVRAQGAISAPCAIGDLDGDGRADIVAGTAKGEVLALGRASGAPLWRHAVGAGIAARCAVAPSDSTTGAAVVAGDRAGVLHLLDGRTGTPRWTARLAQKALGAPLVAHLRGRDRPSVVVGDADGGVRAVALATGAVEWASSLSGAVTLEPRALDRADGADVVVACADGSVHALDGATGKPLWSEAVQRPAVGAPLVVAAPGGALVLVAGGDGLVKAFRADRGTVAWTVALDGLLASGELVAPGTILLASTGGEVRRVEIPGR